MRFIVGGMLMDEKIVAAFQAYVDACSAGDVDAICALYADDAIVEDPVDSEPHKGIDAIREFYTGAVGGIGRFELEGSVRVRGNKGAAPMLCYPAGAEDSLVMETLDVMEFDADGKVTRMIAYWGDSNLKPL